LGKKNQSTPRLGRILYKSLGFCPISGQSDGDQGFTFKSPASLADSDVGLQLGELTFSHGSEDGAAVTTVMGMTNDGQFEVKLSGHVNLEEESFIF
jgi:hypothetical protein